MMSYDLGILEAMLSWVRRKKIKIIAVIFVWYAVLLVRLTILHAD
jgi:hypothetical protein